MKLFRMDLTWLNALETTRYKLVIAVWLCVGTFLVWAICALFTIAMEEVSFGLWLTFLAGLIGFSFAQYKTMRTTDYGYQERQAAIEAAKAVPASVVTVQPGAVNVAATTTEVVK